MQLPFSEPDPPQLASSAPLRRTIEALQTRERRGITLRRQPRQLRTSPSPAIVPDGASASNHACF